jgi:hypothetical protein
MEKDTQYNHKGAGLAILISDKNTLQDKHGY